MGRSTNTTQMYKNNFIHSSKVVSFRMKTRRYINREKSKMCNCDKERRVFSTFCGSLPLGHCSQRYITKLSLEAKSNNKFYTAVWDVVWKGQFHQCGSSSGKASYKNQLTIYSPADNVDYN